MVSRKTLGLDKDLVNELRSVVIRRGMNLASYLRKLIREAVELERRGYYAPRALAEKRFEYLLKSFNFTYVPAELLSNSLSDESLRNANELGRRLGATLKELNVDVYEFLEFLGNSSSSIIYEGDRLILTPVSDGRRLVLELIKGLALGGGLDCEDRGVFVVKVPKEVLEKVSKAVDEGLEGRRGRKSFRGSA
ncbi:MAG: hypothetical protein QW596_01635 [Sulfolobales archaeon]